jgi:hypothetical protein
MINQTNYFSGSDVVRNNITLEQYEEFKKYYVFDALRDIRYGQSFCNYFNIPDGTPLFYFKDHMICEKWITDNYLVKNET